MRPPRAGRDAGGKKDGELVLDQEFGAATLAGLRLAVQECAAAAGLAGERVIDVVLAVHELAANVVRHGAGQGRLLVEITPEALHCEVSDASPDGQPAPKPGGPGPGGGSEAATETNAAPSWPVEHGHGLWLVRNTADRVQVSHGPAGSAVYLAFTRPAS